VSITYVGKLCECHPELDGVRYDSTRTCVACAKEAATVRYWRDKQQKTHANLLAALMREKNLENECQRLRAANDALSRNTDHPDVQAAAYARKELLRKSRGPS
jgi:hypothetical protein